MRPPKACSVRQKTSFEPFWTKIGSQVFAVAVSEESKKGKKVTASPYISPYSPAAVGEGRVLEIFLVGHVPNAVTNVKFHVHRLSGFCTAGVPIMLKRILMAPDSYNRVRLPPSL